MNGVFVDRFKGDSTPPSPTIPLPAFGVDDLKDEDEAVVPVANGDDVVFELIGIFVISTRSMAGDDRSLDERCPAFFRSAIQKYLIILLF